MRKVILFSIIFLIPTVSFAVGNGTISVTPETSQFTNLQAFFSHDTSQGSLDRNVLVIYNEAGTVRQWIATSSGYMLIDGLSPKYLYELGTTLPTSTYTIANMSLNNACCTDQQIIDNTDTIAEMNTFSAGYYVTDTFVVIPAVSSTATSSLTYTKEMTYTILVFLLFLFMAWIVFKIVK